MQFMYFTINLLLIHKTLVLHFDIYYHRILRIKKSLFYKELPLKYERI